MECTKLIGSLIPRDTTFYQIINQFCILASVLLTYRGWTSIKSLFDLEHIDRLTHWDQDKMVAISADDIFMCIFLNEIFCIFNKISLKYVP